MGRCGVVMIYIVILAVGYIRSCSAVSCLNPGIPANGNISPAPTNGTTYLPGSVVRFTCNPGHTLVGSKMMFCQYSGNWFGTQPYCKSCPSGYYKSEERSCIPCPANSNTNNTEGNMREGCMCDEGYQGNNGGPCTDINECLANGGKGPCEEICENREGGYRCSCSIPGYKLSDDGHKCIEQCRNLTVEDAPGNGGLVCHWYKKQNCVRCGQLCNDGYMLVFGTNIYEYCGPETGYVWSFQQMDSSARLQPCIEEYIPGWRFESDEYYFTTNCASLSANETSTVYNNFKSTLDGYRLCAQKTNQTCNTEDMEIVCGRSV